MTSLPELELSAETRLRAWGLRPTLYNVKIFVLLSGAPAEGLTAQQLLCRMTQAYSGLGSTGLIYRTLAKFVEKRIAVRLRTAAGPDIFSLAPDLDSRPARSPLYVNTLR